MEQKQPDIYKEAIKRRNIVILCIFELLLFPFFVISGYLFAKGNTIPASFFCAVAGFFYFEILSSIKNGEKTLIYCFIKKRR